MRTSKRPRGRYAPSPTGELHLGNASTALLAWLSARGGGGDFILRMEDLDQPRVQPGAAERILADLRWLGLDWDEGPDVGGPRAPYTQWQRLARYDEAFARLESAGRVYRCFCSRKDVAAAASAPQLPGDEVRYSGRCRDLAEAEVLRRIDAGAAHAWRFRVDADALPEFDDLVRGRFRWPDREPPGDFVVRRADGVPSYQLAVVVDDAAMGMTEVVRGDDLLPSTVRQLLLYGALGFEPPAFGHVPLLLGTDGVRLSKRHRGTTIRELRESGLSAERIVGRLAHLTGISTSLATIAPRDLVEGFAIGRTPQAPQGLVVDVDSWAR